MVESLLSKAANIADLKRLARSRIPGFAFDYLSGGCNDDNTVKTNRRALDQVYLAPHYLEPCADVDTHVEIFGQTFNAPFGIAPIGLSGVIWPNASEIQARAAHQANIPFVLSSVSTTSVEVAANHAKKNFWFQLYPPKDISIRNDIMKRASDAGCETLVVTLDVPSVSWRPKDIKNGLAVPPKITFKNIFQSALCPAWGIQTLKVGLPQFKTLKPYIEDELSLKETAHLIRHMMREIVDQTVLKQIRNQWKGNLVVKGVNTLQAARLAIECGVDGLIISNHGGRQLDAAVSPVQNISEIADALSDKAVIMADSGVESGIDVGRYLANGAQMVFAGRAFMYGVAALGKHGCAHTIDIILAELTQLMEQLRCEKVNQLKNHRI